MSADVFETEEFSCGDHISLEISRSIRTCLIFPEQVVSLRPIVDQMNIGDYEILDNLLIRKDFTSAENLGNIVFLEMLNVQNRNLKGMEFYVVLQSCAVAFTITSKGASSKKTPKIIKYEYKTVT